MTGLIYEIVWIRPLSLIFGTTIYAVSIIVAAFLLGLSLGSWLAGKYGGRINNSAGFYGLIEFGIGLYGIILISIFSVLPDIYLQIYKATFPNFSLFLFFEFLVAFLVVLIPTSLMGATLPFVLRFYSSQLASVGRDIGRLYSVNNIGAVIGTLAAGFLLIPIFGIKYSLVFTGVLNLGIAGLLTSFTMKSRIKIIVIVAILAIITTGIILDYNSKVVTFGMFVYARPYFDMSDINKFVNDEKMLFYKESLYSSITVMSFNNTDTLAINGKTQCSSNPSSIKGLIDLGAIPYSMFEYNHGKPHNALNVGLGCGTTSRWLSDRIPTKTVEIDPEIVKASQFFNNSTGENLIIDDARNWLGKNNEKFDIIVSQPVDPFVSGGNLFTYEYFLLVKNSLSDDGVVSQWVPIYLMSLKDFYIFFNTFHSIFPHVYIYWDDRHVEKMVFIGSLKPLKIDNENGYLCNDTVIPKVETTLNTDDKPVLIFSSAENLYKSKSNEILEKMIEWNNR